MHKKYISLHFVTKSVKVLYLWQNLYMENLNEYIKDKVKLFLEKYNLVSSKQPLLVGFSGGYDSTCLLEVLASLSLKYGFSLAAAHLNHNWRGKESDDEEFNAKKFCNERGIEFFSRKLSEDCPKTEEEARNQRYKFFEEIALKIGTNVVITGHTQSDQVETVLYRIIKGTGLNGLKGIPEMREHLCEFSAGKLFIYRPLLEIKRAETIKYCKINNLSPNNDSSNQKQDYQRNKIRLCLIPELKKYNSSAEEALLRLSAVAYEGEEIISEYLSQIKSVILNKNRAISTLEFVKLSAALQKRLMCEIYTDYNIEFDYKKISEAVDFIKESVCLTSGNTLSVGENNWLFCSKEEIKIIDSIKSEKITDIIEFSLEGETLFSALKKKIKSEALTNFSVKNFPNETDMRILADFSKVKSPLFLRTRREGDVFQPFGMKEKTKLKKFLINKGVPEHERDKILLLTNQNEVLWVVGVGMSELLRVINKPTHRVEVL